MKFTFFFFLSILTFFSAPVLGQNGDREALLAQLKGKGRYDFLNENATLMRESEQDLAIRYSLEADSLASLVDDFSAKSRALENLGWIYYRRGQWQKSFDHSTKAYDYALLAEDKLQAARIMNNLGALYYEQQNYDKAIEQFRKGFELAVEVKDISTQIRSLNNIALNFTQSGRQDSALHYAKRSIAINESAGSPYLLSFANRVIGDVYMAKGKYDTATTIYETSLEMARVQQVKSFEAGVLHRLGNAYFLNGEINKATALLNYAVDFCRENQFLDELTKSHKYLAEVYQAKGNINQAYFHLSAYQTLSDSLISKAGRDRLALMQGMFDQDLATKQVELLKAQNESQKYRIHANNRYMLIGGIASLMILILGVWMFILHRNLKKTHTDLLIQQQKSESQNLELESKSRELSQINETKNKLFSILGHDLKGPIGQVKSVMDLMMRRQLDQEEFMELLSYLKNDIDTVDFTLNNTLKWSVAQLEGFEIKSVEFDLNPIIQNVLALLQYSIKKKNLVIFNQTGANISVYGEPESVEVSIRNIISNAIKFSNPGDAITIYTEKDRGWVNLYILDQGVGIEKTQLEKLLSENYTLTKSQPGTQKEKGSGLGLQLVKEFIKRNNGEISIESQLGHGTKVCIKLPVPLLQEVDSVGQKKLV
ncbi:tetratricopeptide repeat-containing sensor histidine kinase [Algoriphagus confluentis]|uniref:histidine kinase n=1 Tax=Algoriphagus confluentis TaxID=1697556 RepID=A0ABQ6PQF3_9BACT|nr:hypothetical protein Aconfl_25240 [Algoriphagus confluentis]